MEYALKVQLESPLTFNTKRKVFDSQQRQTYRLTRPTNCPPIKKEVVIVGDCCQNLSLLGPAYLSISMK